MEILLTAGGKFCLPDAGKTDYRALGKLLTVERKKSLPHCGKNTLPSTLMTKETTRRDHDRDARAGKVTSRGNGPFGKPETKANGGQGARHKAPIRRNEPLSACDIVREMLDKAYRHSHTACMRDMTEETVEVCRGTDDKHLRWFANLVGSHMEGIIAHAKHKIGSGRVEGTNTMIKTLRRAGYGYPDDEYLFLKVFDRSRRFVGREAIAQ